VDDSDDTVIAPPRPPAPAADPAADARPDTDDTVIPMPALRSRIDHATGEPVGEPAAAASTAPIITAYYRFRVGERSESIRLDVPCYIGRRPSPPRVVTGLAPRLVRVPSPHQEVSATHLEVRQLGASVIVTDLRSTNGSVVMLPGSVPRKLRQGESVVVSPGTLVDIGDDNIIQILPMQRPAGLGQEGQP
jgi:hypothetical protein